MRYLNLQYIILAALICIFISSISLASASCIKLKTSKAIYFPGETVQIEIDADVTRTITSNDIFLYRKSRLPLAIFSSKVTDTKYFAWFDLPKQTGAYTIKVRGYCPSLHYAELPIEIKNTTALQHSNFKTRIENKWKTLPLETHILGAGALAYDEITEQAFSEYTKRTDSCVNTFCSTKEAALTLMSFDNMFLKQEMYDLLGLYQNHLKKLGKWQLQISSNILQHCNITIENITTAINVNKGINFFDLTEILAQPNFKTIIRPEFSCEHNFNATLNYLYKNKNLSKNFKLTKEGNKLVAAIDNSGCFGNGFKTTCDGSATSYALLALKLTNNLDYNNLAHISALSWLQENAKTIEEKAVIYYLTENNKTLTWLLAAQNAAGFWPNKAYEPDVKVTALALFALRNSEIETAETGNAISKTEIWLKSQDLILSDEAFVLFFAFSPSEIEPVLSIWPGFIKTASRSSFNLILTNKGMTDIEINATLFDFSTTAVIEKNSMKNMHFDVPIAVTLDGRSILSTLAINYNSKLSDNHHLYSIPLIIFTEQGDKEYIGEPKATEQEINQTEQQTIINETKGSPLENKTTELNVSLIKKNFRFLEKNLTLNVNRTDEPFIETITLGNAFDKNIRDIELSLPIELKQFGFVVVEPSFISSMAPGEKVKINVSIDPSVVLSKVHPYSGYIQVKAVYDMIGMTTTIPVSITVSAPPAELLNCSERGGIFCDPESMECENELITTVETSYCCIPAEACKEKVPAGRNIGLAIVAFLIVALLVLFFILRKRPKKEMKTFLEEKAKELERQRIKRPPSIGKKPAETSSFKTGSGIPGRPRRRFI